MIHATLQGMIMEKVHTQKSAKYEEKFQVRMFQRGNKDLVNITVSGKTFDAIKENTPIEIKVKADLWNNEGSYGMYVSEATTN